jgi:hypothetical protein
MIEIMNDNRRFPGYLQVIDNKQTGYEQITDSIAVFKYRLAMRRLSGIHAENHLKNPSKRNFYER